MTAQLDLLDALALRDEGMDRSPLECGVSPTSMEPSSTIVRPFSTVKGPPQCSRKLRDGPTRNTLSRRAAGLDLSIPRGTTAPETDTQMTRARFDPGFLSSDTWERLGVDAYVLHTQACAHVVHTLSDGFISTGRALTLTPLVKQPQRTVQTLVDAGLWTVVDGGYVVCECHDDLRRSDGRGDEQPSKAGVALQREQTRKRKDAWRERRRNGVPNDGSNGVSNEVGNGVRNTHRHTAIQTSAVQEPTVPVPALLGDDDAVCEHGTPGGKLQTSAGDPRCPMCRRLTVVPDSA